ncbi:hypothetical protein NKH24_34730 [Mesorhizobium sp. M1300]|uniref:hypothetical protein n=1 Tax=Mesorhizobium sp. M1300 TaxID=2957077 RepID=UPI00333C7B56
MVGQFLKAGVLAEDQFLRTDDGTPQGGIVSPLLANIALSAIEERYERWTYQRAKARPDNPELGVIAARKARSRDRDAGRCVFLPIRYADDFVVLVSGTQKDAIAEKAALAEYLLRATTGLELSPKDKGHGHDGWIRVPRIPCRHAMGQALRLRPARRNPQSESR